MTCSYNLRTLAMIGVCPECGHTVRHTLEYGADLTDLDHAAIKPMHDTVQNMIAMSIVAIGACVLTGLIVRLFGAWALLGTLAITLPVLVILFIAQAVSFVRESSRLLRQTAPYFNRSLNSLTVVLLLGAAGLFQHHHVASGITVLFALIHFAFAIYLAGVCRRVSCVRSLFPILVFLVSWPAAVFAIVTLTWSLSVNGQLIALSGLLFLGALHPLILLQPMIVWLRKAGPVALFHLSKEPALDAKLPSETSEMQLSSRRETRRLS